jgi:bifunctional non-homologous end joining protein LigD
LAIAGFALDGNKWDGLYVGAQADLVYAGKVDPGFDRESAKPLRERLTPLVRETQLYSKRIATASGSNGRTQAARKGRVSSKVGREEAPHPFFKGLRETSDGKGCLRSMVGMGRETARK